MAADEQEDRQFPTAAGISSGWDLADSSTGLSCIRSFNGIIWSRALDIRLIPSKTSNLIRLLMAYFMLPPTFSSLSDYSCFGGRHTALMSVGPASFLQGQY